MDVGHVMSNFPPIIENIFKYLTQRELDSCSEVCYLWKRIAETEKNRREDIFTFLQVLPCKYHETVHFNMLRDCPMDQEITGEMESGLSQQLKELKMKPRFCLAFASESLVDEFGQLFPTFKFPSSSQAKRVKHEDLLRKRSYIKAVVETALGRYLPAKCETTFLVAPGIIGCSQGGLPLEIEDGYGISGILIPSVPGAHIFSFPIDEKKCDISKWIPENLDVKCLLMFMTPHESSCYDKIIQSCLLRQNSRLALGGALVDRAQSGSGTCVAFCGQGVEAASIILRPKQIKEDIETKLRLFQQTGLLKNRCLAFMFACVARGYHVHNKYNAESSIFRSLYPDVPLIGVFGNGEIGHDYIPNMPNNHQLLHIGRLVRCRKKYVHSFTTIFVLVSLHL